MKAPEIASAASDLIGRKDDGGKDPWHLAPWDAFCAIVRVIGFGAEKYAPRNWENGMDWSRVFSAAQRHLTSWWDGENTDPETGMSHLWHAGCCLVFLIAYERRKTGKDDRPATLEQSRKDQSWADAAVAGEIAARKSQGTLR
jgi:Domain of unknown function (DUF5664)